MKTGVTAESAEIKIFLNSLISKLHALLETPVIGIYLHGSLAMGGFNPARSDIDLLVVTEEALQLEAKKRLVSLFLEQSGRPFPVEISFLTTGQLETWQFPTPYDFHFSEYWRERYEQEIAEGTFAFLEVEEKYDIDVAAHFMILNRRGICLEGRPIEEVFPAVPEADYLASIMDDYQECLKKIHRDPVYSLLNLLRVYWYIKEKKISSKPEAGHWGMSDLPAEFSPIIKKTVKAYERGEFGLSFDELELTEVSDYINGEVERLLTEG